MQQMQREEFKLFYILYYVHQFFLWIVVILATKLIAMDFVLELYS
jgi:hypothetical protein